MNKTNFITEKKYNIISTLQTLFVLISFVTIFYYNFGIAQVPSESMQPTIPIGTITIFNCVSADEMDYNDIVTFFYDAKPDIVINNGLEAMYYDRICHNTVYVKRLVGKPGDVIEIINSYLYRNGERLYTEKEIIENMEPYVVPEGTFYCLGDNRSNSYDSIYAGAFSQNLFFGKVIVKL